MEKRSKHKLVLAGLILLITFAGVLLAAFYGNKSIMPIIFFNAGLIFFVIIVFIPFRKGDLPDRDERIKKMSAYGITYSWLVTLVAITGLSMGQYLRLINLTAEEVLGILLFFMIISANIFRWYFLQKGDIE